MEILSRTGNAAHTVYRQETTLTVMNRIHKISLAVKPEKPEDWSRVVTQACIGKPPEYKSLVNCYKPFVQNYSGGQKAHVLEDLVLTERRLQSSRKLDPETLEKIGELKLPEAPRYPPMMFKCLIMSLLDFVVNGFSFCLHFRFDE